MIILAQKTRVNETGTATDIEYLDLITIIQYVRYERWSSWKNSTPEQKIRNATKVKNLTIN